MADNCHVLEGWPFYTDFADGCWASDAIAHETETLTRALQLSLSAPDTGVLAAAAAGCFPLLVSNPEPAASDAEARSRRLPLPQPPAGKISKRKSRASRRPATTFIAADPANFRRMVQQATGARLAPGAEATALRPESWRPGKVVDCLPTLDTSALLLGSGWAAAAAVGSSRRPSPDSGAELTFALDGELPLPFPTLESCCWGSM